MYMSGREAAGAVERLSSTTSRPSARRITATPPPKKPTIIGSTTVRVNSAATVASMALPPIAIISIAAADASGWLVTAMPRWALTGVFSVEKVVPAKERQSCLGSRVMRASCIRAGMSIVARLSIGPIRTSRYFDNLDV
jgi:hypothetical protein